MDARHEAGHDAEDTASALTALFPDSLFKQPSVITRILSSRPRVGPSFLSSSRPSPKARGMARQVAQPLFFVAALPLESTGASRRATQTSLTPSGLICGRLPYGTGPRFSLAVSVSGPAIRQPAPGRQLILTTE